MTRIKICGLTRPEDIELAVDLGASALGFVLEPTSLRRIHDDDVWTLLRHLPPIVFSVAVLGRFQDSQALRCFNAVQAIGVTLDQLAIGQHAVSVYRPGSEDPVPTSADCSAILLDAYSTEGFGGTGKRLDIELAQEVMRNSSLPVIVAGGLKPDNVGTYIKALRPYGVDVSSGVETRPGVKDAGAMRAFFAAVAEADADR